MEIQAIASGSGGNCYLLSSGEDTLLIECGMTWGEMRRGLPINVSSLSGILVSHDHKDHCKAAEDALRYGQDVYMTVGTANALGLEDYGLHVIDPFTEYTTGGWSFMPFPVFHGDASEPVGYRIIAPDGDRVAYATDTQILGYKTEDMNQARGHKFRNLTHLMIEANYDEVSLQDSIEQGLIPSTIGDRVRNTHMSLETLLKTLRILDLSNVREIWLIHMSRHNADPVKIVKRVREETGLPVYLAGKEEEL